MFLSDKLYFIFIDKNSGMTNIKYSNLLIFSFIVQQPLVGEGFLIIETSRSHSDTPHSVGLLWTSDQPETETFL